MSAAAKRNKLLIFSVINQSMQFSSLAELAGRKDRYRVNKIPSRSGLIFSCNTYTQMRSAKEKERDIKDAARSQASVSERDFLAWGLKWEWIIRRSFLFIK